MAIGDAVDRLRTLLAAPFLGSRPRHARWRRAVGRGRLVYPRTELVPVPVRQRRARRRPV